jgi:hypothetical protein
MPNKFSIYYLFKSLEQPPPKSYVVALLIPQIFTHCLYFASCNFLLLPSMPKEKGMDCHHHDIAIIGCAKDVTS